uniref:Outer membrane lipoprotein-sorting protein n=1 Tax=Candidatus Kentrum sp. TUN TaxID=2126343 RepID=A0A450ZJY2_9GAMM|nr:MAG: Outer membrane lipoprotein-sorting protein [Candidatus Kentron sp. TUN]VFK54067.1 MAG: Outer membrane lipoprotein-sorting protein [Candidatus Kentron sp. TUN]VFK55267.1 MAG: Outer membrane lipoprotein-sorting protein [Candidatus Kentron sp. TUN]
MKYLFLILLFWSQIPWAAPTTCSETPQAILDAVDAIRAPGDDFGFSLEVTHVRPNKDDLEYEFDVRVKDRTKSLVKYTAPLTARGKLLLMLEENMWIYIPGTRRAIRISPQQQLLGQVSNADVARVVYSIDYRADAMVEEKSENTDAYRVTLKPRNNSPYGKIELVVAKSDCRPLKAAFYTLSGRLLKTISYHDYRDVAGRSRPMQLEIEDAIKKGERTLLDYSNLDIVDTPDSWFQKNYLPRLK